MIPFLSVYVSAILSKEIKVYHHATNAASRVVLTRKKYRRTGKNLDTERLSKFIGSHVNLSKNMQESRYYYSPIIENGLLSVE